MKINQRTGYQKPITTPTKNVNISNIVKTIIIFINECPITTNKYRIKTRTPVNKYIKKKSTKTRIHFY